MPRESRELRAAIEAEVAEWPGVSVAFEPGTGGGHPKAALTFNGHTVRRAWNGNSPGGRKAVAGTLKDMRQVMLKLGATRREEPTDAKDEEAADRAYHKPNDGRARRSSPVKAEPAAAKPSIADQLALIGVDNKPEPLGEGTHDIDEDRYHADPCAEPSLSGSLAKIMIERSPFHAWHAHPRLNQHWQPDKDLLAHRIGRAFHTMLLGKGAPIEVYPHADWKKQVARDERDDALKRGATPLLEHQHEQIEAMVRAARYQIRQREELKIAMAGGVPERVYIWREETPSGPIWCRMMVDWTPHGGRYPVDWKTTASGAGPDGWGQRTMWDMGSDIQDAFYRRGFLKTIGVDYDALMFAVIESDAPHALMHHRVDPEAQDEADKDVQWAINAFGACLYRKRWPGYPLDMAWQTKPGWRAQRSELRREHGQRDLAMLDEQMAMIAAVQPRLEGAEVTADNPFGLAPIASDGAS
jgi:hypothetical protein